MSGHHYPCPVPGESGVRAGDGGRPGAMLRAGACGGHADEAAVELLLRHGHWAGHREFVRRFGQVDVGPDLAGAPARFPPGTGVAGAGGRVRRGQGR